MSLGALLPVGAYWVGYDAGLRAADENAVYEGIWRAVHVAPRVAALADTVSRLKQQMARQAAQRLPDRVRDSLRLVRWSTPP